MTNPFTSHHAKQNYPIARYQNKLTHRQFDLIFDQARLMENKREPMEFFFFHLDNVSVSSVEKKYQMSENLLRHSIKRFNKVADSFFEFKELSNDFYSSK